MDVPTAPSLAELLAAMLERTRGRYRTELPTKRPPRRRLPIVGCLVRLVLLVIVLIALLLGGVFAILTG